ncbi:MAG: PG0541 family transporter-associated protein [Polyangiales bacterium]
MKLLHITVQFQYADVIERMLESRGVREMVRHPRIVGHDSDGWHDGSQAFPGHMAAVHAQVDDGAVDEILDDLRRFRDQKPAHGHLCAAVLPIETTL